MKKVLLLALSLTLTGLGAAQAQNSASASAPAGTAKVSGPQIQFDQPKYDFTSVVQGAVVNHTFKFKNVGTAPLIITNIQVSCGCTTPEYPKDTPIAPGKTGTITAHFNSASKIGMQNKVLTIESNSVAGPASIALVGDVKEPGDTTTATTEAGKADVMTEEGKQKNSLNGAKIKAKKKRG